LRLLPRILADEDELDHEPEREEKARDQDHAGRAAEVPPGPGRRWVVSVAATAVVARLVYLFAFTDPENA